MTGFLRRLTRRGPTVDEGDQQVIAAIAATGADLGREREIIHYLYFDTDAGTRAAVAAIDRDDRFVHAVIDPDTGRSSVKVTHTDVLTIELVRGLRAEFERAAAAHGGKYDGWEAAAKP